MINIACVLRQGGKVGYDATWVKKLYNSISKNLTFPFRFICLSDCEVPVERIPLEEVGTGYWAKLQLFRKNLFDTPVLFFDLDTVICGNIDQLVKNILEQNDFLMWKDPTYNISSSAIMYWNGNYSYIYEKYLENKKIFEETYFVDNKDRLVGDQAVISSLVQHKFINDFCPKSWIHIVGKQDLELKLDDVRIAIFRKAHTKPSTMPNHPLVKKHWI